MKITDHRQAAVELKAAPPGNSQRSTGPKSEQGKLRSALNSVRHGLAGTHLLLPGEDAVEYEQRMNSVFAALSPETEAAAQIVAFVADDMWKLERLGKIEHGIINGRIEELMSFTKAAETAGTTTKAIAMLGAALTTWVKAPATTKLTVDFTRCLCALSEAIEFIGSAEIGLPAEVIESGRAYVEALMDVSITPSGFQGAHAGLDRAARTLMGLLLQQGDRDEAAQGSLRAAIATIALPDERELKKLARYRKLLEEGLQRRLQALEQLRKLTAASVTNMESADRAREFRLKLRVVA